MDKLSSVVFLQCKRLDCFNFEKIGCVLISVCILALIVLLIIFFYKKLLTSCNKEYWQGYGKGYEDGLKKNFFCNNEDSNYIKGYVDGYEKSKN